MLYWLSAFSDTIGPLNVLRYITFRTGGAMITALIFVFLFGPWIIDHLRLRQGKGQPIRTDGPQSHLVTKKGTPTMGGLMILSGLVVSTLLWANLANRYVWIVLGVTLTLRRDRLLRRLPQGHEADPCRRVRQAPPRRRVRDRGGGLLFHRVARAPAIRQLAHFSLLQGADPAAGLALHRRSAAS